MWCLSYTPCGEPKLSHCAIMRVDSWYNHNCNMWCTWFYRIRYTFSLATLIYPISVSQKLTQRLLQNSAQVTTAVLLCSGQKYVSIWWLGEAIWRHRDLCQNLFGEGFVACWHQAIVWTDADSLWSCNALCVSLGLKMLNVLNESWSVSVLIYMLYALCSLSALNVYYMTHGVSVCLFSVLNVCYMTHGMSVYLYICYMPHRVSEC